jgi:hypothetical protein
MSLLLFLTHFLYYYEIQPAIDLYVTSYCDNSSLLTTEEQFHTREVDRFVKLVVKARSRRNHDP